MAIVIYTHGLDGICDAFDRKRPETGDEWTLVELQEIVGGYIEPLPVQTATAFVNEDGLSLDLAKNPVASALFGIQLVGTVVVLEPQESLP
jgi:hypothetical protein